LQQEKKGKGVVEGFIVEARVRGRKEKSANNAPNHGYRRLSIDRQKAVAIPGCIEAGTSSLDSSIPSTSSSISQYCSGTEQSSFCDTEGIKKAERRISYSYRDQLEGSRTIQDFLRAPPARI